MANAHLPNCHPDVTPDWFQETFSRTTYLEAIQTSLVEGFDGGRYQGYVQPGWCSSAGRQLAAHGGYCVGALMTTCQQFFAKQHGDMNQPDCIGVHVEFLAPVPQGNYHVTVKDVALGGRQSVVEACIVSSDIRRPKTYIIGLVRMGRLIEDKEAPGIPIPTTHIPDRVLECTRVTNANYYRASPATATVRIFSPKDGVSSMWSPVFGGQNCRDRWHKMDDETLFETEHLPLIADLIPAIPLNYEKDLSTIFQWRMPTTSLTPDIKSDPRGNEWLLTRAAMRRFYNGRFDMDIKIIDDGGNIIATCTQACLAIPAKVSKSKGKGEKL